MPLKSDDNQASKPKDLVPILASAGGFDTQCRVLAQKFDKDRHVYYTYAALDSLSSSYSMFKYFFDLCISSNDPNLMHDMMMTPGGIIAITLETIFLVAFSVLAVKFENEKEDSFKKFIATAWPYFRDVMKGLKNAYKGWRSAVVAVSLIGGLDIKYLMAPVGLVLGIFAAANRFWLRGMVEDRKVMMNTNEQLRKEIKQLLFLTREGRQFYLRQIKYQSDNTRWLSYLSVGLGGFLDGLYLYVGVLGLAALSFPMFIAMVAICAFYTLACVVIRVYEEYDFQMRLFITQTKCKLELIAKELETTYSIFLSLQSKSNKNQEDLLDLIRLRKEIYSVLNEFEEHRKLLRKQLTNTYLTATLIGLKNGLYAYGAVASIIFFSASILVLCGVGFPPALLVISVLLGLVFVVGFIIHSLVVNYKHLNMEQTKVERPYDHLNDMKNKIKLNLEIEEPLEAGAFHQSVKDGLSVDPSPQFFFQEWFEVLRSLFSGFGKGQKFVDFAGNSMQDLDEQGHYHDTTIMYVLALFSAILFGATLALRAFARGFGRRPLAQEATEPVASEALTKLNIPDNLATVVLQNKAQKNSAMEIEELPIINWKKDIAESQTKVPGKLIQMTTLSSSHSDSKLSVFGLFETKSKDNKHFHRSGSDATLSSRDIMPDYTIQGLA